MDNEYKVIKEFCCCGRSMVTVRIENAAHVMSLEEWHKIYGRNHMDRFAHRNKYNKKNAS